MRPNLEVLNLMDRVRTLESQLAASKQHETEVMLDLRQAKADAAAEVEVAYRKAAKLAELMARDNFQPDYLSEPILALLSGNALESHDARLVMEFLSDLESRDSKNPEIKEAINREINSAFKAGVEEEKADRAEHDARLLGPILEAADSVIAWEKDYRTINNLGKLAPHPFDVLEAAIRQGRLHE